MLLPLALLATLLSPARAGEPHMGSVEGPLLLPEGAFELEIWALPLAGPGVRSLANRASLSLPVSEVWGSAVHLDWTAELEGTRFDALTWEWARALPALRAAPVDLSLAGALGAGPAGQAIELGLGLERELGAVRIAASGLARLERAGWAWSSRGEPVATVEGELGVLHQGARGLELGGMLHAAASRDGGGAAEGRLLAGPRVGYASARWWCSAEALPTLAPASAAEGLGARLLLGAGF